MSQAAQKSFSGINPFQSFFDPLGRSAQKKEKK